MSGFRQLLSGDSDIEPVLALIQRSYAYMEGEIDPPSSIHRLNVQAIDAQCVSGEVWVCGAPPTGCVFLGPKADHLYVGKLAVAETHRGAGLGRALLDLAAERGQALGFDVLELDVRIELLNNQAFFEACGFAQVVAWAHEGFARATCLRMRKTLIASHDGARPV